MKKIELHAKTKYSLDYDSIIDIESLIFNAKEANERGIVVVDKDTIVAFPKIEKIYNKICLKDASFKDFKIGYGVQLTSIIEEKLEEIVILVKNQRGLKNLYKIMSIYESTYKIPFNEVLKYKDGLLIGLMLKDNDNLDLSLFDYIEVNKKIDTSKIDNIVVYSNNPNSFFPGDIKALEILYFRKKITKKPECRLYLDKEDTLKTINDEQIVIENTNLIFDKLENIIINDLKFYTNEDNYIEFASRVKTTFKNKYKNPSLKLKERLDKELNLIKELKYTYYFNILNDITKFIKDKNQYYQLDGYINNMLISYILDITDIEPYNLPYELFFQKTPDIIIKISPKFYKEQLYDFIKQKFNDKLIKHSYGYKLSKDMIPYIIKRYEKKIDKKFKLYEKDYICNLLDQIIINKEVKNNSYYIIPNNNEIEDFTPISKVEENIKCTYYDYDDLKDNLIKIKFIPNEDIEFITNLRNITKAEIKLCNQKEVYDLFKDIEAFNTRFDILDRKSGLLNINLFDNKIIERKLKSIPNLWLDDLINIITNLERKVILDDLYNGLKEDKLDDLAIFSVINYIENLSIKTTSKATIINKIRISYMQMYYKLYFKKEYYRELISNYDIRYIDDKIFSCNIETLKERYMKLNKVDRIWMTLKEKQELGFLEILFEMYERKINFKLEKRKVVIY